MTDSPTDPDTADQLVARLGPFWSADKVRTALHLPTLQDVDAAVHAGTVLALPTSDGRHLFPVFQFEQTGTGIRIRPALAGWIRELHDQDPWSVAVLATAPFDELDRMSPLEWARAGRDPQRVTDLAHVVRRTWAQ